MSLLLVKTVILLYGLRADHRSGSDALESAEHGHGRGAWRIRMQGVDLGVDRVRASRRQTVDLGRAARY